MKSRSNLYGEDPTVSAEAEEIETAEATLPAEQEEAASPRTFLRLAFRNIDPRAVTSVYVDIHIFDKATNELSVVRDRRYLVPILGRDAVFGADEEIDVDDAAYSFSVAIKKVQFEGEDVFWNGSASLLFENLPEQAKIADVMEDEDLRAQYQRDFTEMAEDKEAAAQFAPQEYKDLWMCACGEVNHKDEEKCAACGAEYGPQHALLEDEEKLKENLEAYNKAEAEKAEAARIERQNQSDAELYSAQKDAEGIQARAKAEAEATRLKGESEGVAEKAHGEGVAAGIKAQAEAYNGMDNPYLLANRYIDIMPKGAEQGAKPLTAVDSIKMYGSGNAQKLVKETTSIVDQVASGLKDSTGIDLPSLLNGLISNPDIDADSAENSVE